MSISSSLNLLTLFRHHQFSVEKIHLYYYFLLPLKPKIHLEWKICHCHMSYTPLLFVFFCNNILLRIFRFFSSSKRALSQQSFLIICLWWICVCFINITLISIFRLRLEKMLPSLYPFKKATIISLIINSITRYSQSRTLIFQKNCAICFIESPLKMVKNVSS